MGQVRNDTGELRVLPVADYTGVKDGQVIDVPDDEVYHWVAGGFTALTRYPVPFRLYPNHQGDPLAYALPEPDADDPSAVAVGPAEAAVPARPPAAQQTVPAATAPAAAPETDAPEPPAADSAKE